MQKLDKWKKWFSFSYLRFIYSSATVAKNGFQICILSTVACQIFSFSIADLKLVDKGEGAWLKKKKKMRAATTWWWWLSVKAMELGRRRRRRSCLKIVGGVRRPKKKNKIGGGSSAKKKKIGGGVRLGGGDGLAWQMKKQVMNSGDEHAPGAALIGWVSGFCFCFSR